MIKGYSVVPVIGGGWALVAKGGAGDETLAQTEKKGDYEAIKLLNELEQKTGEKIFSVVAALQGGYLVLTRTL